MLPLDWLVFLLLVLPYLAFAAPAFVGRLRPLAATPAWRAAVATSVLVPVAILSLSRSGIDPAANAGDLAGWALLVGAVLVLLSLRPTDAPPLHWTCTGPRV
jgi:hypothetical protein